MLFRSVISNARCLTEGVDVPAVDMVAFISPRKSKVDIVQATGRAMRRSPGKEFGYVMVPLFLEQAANETIEEALQRTRYDDIWELLAAMREQDDVLVDIIREMRVEKGKTGGYDDSRFRERVEMVGPSLSLEEIRGAITAECLESLGASWDEWYGMLLAYVEQEGNCRIPQRYRTIRGHRLGQWVSKQRSDRDGLPSIRKKQLEALPDWTWDILADQWEIGLQHLLEFEEREGHYRVPQDYRTSDGLTLGLWVTVQRTAKANGRLPDYRRERLEALNGWVWDVYAHRWETGLRHLLEYTEREGHCRVPRKFNTDDGFYLGEWISRQRRDKADLTEKQKERLDAVPGWVWDDLVNRWETGLRYLSEFSAREGNCKVPALFVTTDGYRLGQWVSNQRSKRNSMPAERMAQLEELSGWTWRVRG